MWNSFLLGIENAIKYNSSFVQQICHARPNRTAFSGIHCNVNFSMGPSSSMSDAFLVKKCTECKSSRRAIGLAFHRLCKNNKHEILPQADCKKNLVVRRI